MTEQEIKNIIQPYIDAYDWMLMARSGNGLGSISEYNYHYVDNKGICIIINPVSKSFEFRKSVDFIFELNSGDFSPLDYPNHFEKFYKKFRNVVIEKGL